MHISAQDIETYATDLKVALEKVVATRKNLTDYQNALLELYGALDNITPVLRDESEKLSDNVNEFFEKVSEMIGLEEVMYFGNKEEQSAKDIIDGLNEIAESVGIRESEEEF